MPLDVHVLCDDLVVPPIVRTVFASLQRGHKGLPPPEEACRLDMWLETQFDTIEVAVIFLCYYSPCSQTARFHLRAGAALLQAMVALSGRACTTGQGHMACSKVDAWTQQVQYYLTVSHIPL